MGFVFLSAAYLAFLLVFWWGLGRALRRWLAPAPAAGAASHALNGFAVATLAATLGHRLGAPFGLIFPGLAALGLLGCGLHLLALRRRADAALVPADAPRLGGLLPLAGAALLFAPLAIGGLQFSLFRSNHYDALNYLQCAVARTAYTHTEIAAAGPREFLQNPLLVTAHRMVAARPAIMDSYALTDSLAPGNLHQLTPAFLTGLLLLAVPALAGLAARQGAGPRGAWLIGLAGIGGFWGQYILDLDAWSLLGALPLALTVYHRLDLLIDPSVAARPPAPALAVPAAALILVYPELACFLAPALALAVALPLGRGDAPRVIRPVFTVLAGTALLLLPCVTDLRAFVESQLTSAQSADHAPLSWTWNVLFGPALPTTPVWLTAGHTLAGALGVFLPWSIGTAAGGINLALLLGSLLGLGVLICAACTARHALALPATPAAVTRLVVVTALLLAQTLAFGLLSGPWTAAKALSYAFPWLLLLAFLPLCVPAAGSRTLRLPAVLLLAVHLALLVARPLAALDENGLGYPAPYPAADPALKINRRWDAGPAPRLLAAAPHVRIDVPDLWLEYYAMICAQAQGRAFTKLTPVREYYDMTPQTYGQQSAPPSVADEGLVFVEFSRRDGSFALGFATGDRVRWSGPRTHTLTRVIGPARLESWQGLLSWWDNAELTVESTIAGPVVLEFLLRRHPAVPASARPAITLSLNGQLLRTSTLDDAAPGTLQGLSLPLTLPAGRNRILITTEHAPTAPAVGFSNPRLAPLDAAPPP